MADNEFGVSDLGSSNGVYVQNVRIESVKLSHRKTFDVARQYKFMLWIGSKESPELVTLLKTLEAI
jgi:pSer/pThr/pTyr-binding forkhead associated (FHA) protein